MREFDLKDYLTEKFDGFEKKVDTLTAKIEKDHDILTEASRQSKENKKSIDSVWNFARKMNVRLITLSTVIASAGVGIGKMF